MNNNNGYNGNYGNNPDYGSRQEMDSIRQNERMNQLNRQKESARLQREERIRRKKMKIIKDAITAWAILIFIVVSVIAIISGIISACTANDDDDDTTEGKALDSVLLQTAEDFIASDDSYSGSKTADKLEKYTQAAATDITEPLTYPSCLYLAAESMMLSGTGNADLVESATRDCPIFSNGYVWSSKESMKFPLTGSYLYDTNASFIIAVCEICKNGANNEFLFETDATTDGNKDVSRGLTVMQKLEKAADYYFDKNDLNGGGIRYNEEDGLVYILTTDNAGLDSSKPSNIFHNHRFGYLDLYNNLLFNKAVKALALLYEDMEDTAKAAFYKNVASKNTEAINSKFWSDSLGRYVGYIDSDGKVHDAGYTALNLLAIQSGVADKDKTDKIYAWIDGERKINTDSAVSGKVYKDLNMPVFNTVAVFDDTWYDKDGTFPYGSSDKYGEYHMNGGQSYASAYFNIGAAAEAKSHKALRNTVTKLTDALEGDSAQGEEIFALTAAYLGAKELFGIDTDGEILYVNPAVSSDESFSVKNVSFADREYGFLFDGNKIYVTCDLNAAVKIKIGSYDVGTAFKLTVAENGKIVSEENVTADKDGNISVYKRFGSTSFVILEKLEEKKK